MSLKRDLCFLCALSGWTWIWPWAACGGPPPEPVLARSVPAEAKLFLELGDLEDLLNSPLGSTMAGMLSGLVPAYTRPAGEESGWRQWFAEAVGLPGAKAPDLLLSGRLALAAEGWSGLGDAVLLAEPDDSAALERELESALKPPDADQKVRRYRLSSNHELACDGRTAVVGLPASWSGLYDRTVGLLGSEHGVSLADLAEFRARTSALPAGCQLVLYGGTNRRTGSAGLVTGSWWPAAWPQLESAAVGVAVTSTGVTVETNGRLIQGGSNAGTGDPPVHVLSRLPASTVVGWTHSISYVQEFQRLEAAYPEGILRFYIDVLRSGLAPGVLEERLLSHLVGDSIFMIGQARTRPAISDDPDGRLRLPSCALAVETDDPYAVELMMQHLAGNLLRLLSFSPGPEGEARIENEALGDGGTIHSIPLGRLFSSRTGGALLRSLAISWAVADRWLVVGTDSGTVREIIQARRGRGAVMPAGVIQEAMRQVRLSRGSAEIVLVAQPRLGAQMIDSWMAYVSRHHPEMLESEWWWRLRQKQHARTVQLGILPARVSPGQVEVSRTFLNWPAHGRLQAGDRILAVDGQMLDKTPSKQQTLRSLREKVAMRRDPQHVTLLVMRDGRQMEIAIAMPAAALGADRLQPVQLLGKVADLLRLFTSASYAAWREPPDVVKARLELRFVPRSIGGSRS